MASRSAGDTLVIDTIGLSDRTTIGNFRTPHTDKLHVTEYWKFAEGGDILEVNIIGRGPRHFQCAVVGGPALPPSTAPLA
jgi:hypothetical protein